MQSASSPSTTQPLFGSNVPRPTLTMEVEELPAAATVLQSDDDDDVNTSSEFSTAHFTAQQCDVFRFFEQRVQLTRYALITRAYAAWFSVCAEAEESFDDEDPESGDDEYLLPPRHSLDEDNCHYDDDGPLALGDVDAYFARDNRRQHQHQQQRQRSSQYQKSSSSQAGFIETAYDDQLSTPPMPPATRVPLWRLQQSPLCHHFQQGFCMFGERCRNLHSLD